MKKLLTLFLLLFLALALMTGCRTNDPADQNPDTNQTENETGVQDGNVADDEKKDEKDEADVGTGPSYVDDELSLEKTMGPDGTWIVIFTDNLTTEKELVLDGRFENKDVVTRKIALYTQDEQRVKTKRFTLTAPKLTIRSENAQIVGGTFRGDVYVEANGFSVDDGKIDGNVYFKNDEYKKSFTSINNGTVTGTQVVK